MKARIGIATATLLACSGAVLAAQPTFSTAPRAKSIIERIGVLEGARDPKCDATASRLEDFMFGTPLAADARFLKNDRQKALIVSIWSAASADAKAAGAKAIPKATIDAAIARAFRHDRDEKAWRITIGGRTQVIDPTDKRQYSTVAYSLRAILAVEQDQILGAIAEMLPLEPEAIDSLKDAVDLYTLAALQRADQQARADKQREISRERMAAAWPVPDSAPAKPAGRTKHATKAGSQGYPVLAGIIEQKLGSFEKYNMVSNQVFLRNLQVYFARHRWPADPQEGMRFRQLFTAAMVAYSQDLLRGSERLARERKRRTISAADVYDFGQKITPHRLNEYEDATFFPRLGREERVQIEAYDMDSFRDGGLHWHYLQEAIRDDKGKGHLEPDPFAAELLTENIAQFGTLLLKEAGRLAKAEGRETLHSSNVEGAMREIQRKIDLDAAAPAAPRPDERLKSTAVAATARSAFEDVTASTGIDYTHRIADWLGKQLRSYIRKDETTATLTIPPAFQGSGVAAEDLDGDGMPDVLLLGGAGIRLYLNAGGGRFRDATAGSGLDWRRADGHAGEARQALVVDFDNDGRQDVLITLVDDDHRIFRNLGGGRFEDMTAQAGLGGRATVAGPAAVLDIDRDGRPDIYIGHFGDYLKGVMPTLARRNTNAIPNRLFRNLGGFRFADVTAGSGADDRGWAQVVSHTDFDGDGWQDIIVGNDFGENAWLRNKGDGTFENVAARIGTDKPSYAMGVAIADLNGDDRPDVYISNIVVMDKDQKYVLPGELTVMKFDPKTLANMRVLEANDLFLSSVKDGGTTFRLSTLVDRGYASTGWSWDAHFFDMDNDGDDDLYVVNGVNPYNVYSDFNPYYKDPHGKVADAYFAPDKTGTNILFANAGGRLDNATEGSGLGYRGTSRSVAYLDMDGDGDLDLVMNNLLEPVVVYRNAAERSGNRWLAVRLEGDPAAGSTRDALGARLILHTKSGNTIWREVRSTGGYLSSNPKEQHFGLGKDEPMKLTIRWPGGKRSEITGLAAGGRYVVTEKDESVRQVSPQPGSARRP